jgi:hypothetical protein
MTKFNYRTLQDPSLQAAARDGAKTIKALLQRNAATVLEIGNLLQGVFDAIGDRKMFAAWLLAELGWQLPYGYAYMSAARQFAGVPHLDKLQPHALIQLARKSTPPAAVKEAISLAAAGQSVTSERARELIERHGPKPTRRDAGIRRVVKAAAAPAATPLAALRATLDQLAGHLSDLALSRSEREELADKFLSLALELRSLSRADAA